MIFQKFLIASVIHINTELSCLLYADDLLILSETETGLRASINKLHSYAKKWQLSVNIKKTKIMVFNIDITHYPCIRMDYLGITFTLVVISLQGEGCKAYYSLNDINIQSGAQISTIYTLVKPIHKNGVPSLGHMH